MYQQEAGRAGRDGAKSACVLFYGYSDYIKVTYCKHGNMTTENVTTTVQADDRAVG